ncbi:SIR2 family protein [Dickeya zeae]|uniref:SIR2 family protein n=1 Tax=Dickeya zeae TaxID=204042 RepID=UPI0003A821D5|nr:SIR2 family protein [Dickeya zeae]
MSEFEGLSFPEKELKEILKASENNKLVFFIGSGFSKFSETEFRKSPDWNELIDELKEDLNASHERDPLKIAQLYFLKFGHHTYVNKIKSSIIELEPSDFHRKLFDLNPHYIITTNWDDLIEKTAKSLGLAYDLISSDADLAQSQLDKKIIKMHGDFRQHNFVFKEDDYLRYSNNFPLIENYIKGIFSTSMVIFLGYSYSDYDLKQIVTWITNISKSTPKKYLLQKNFDDAQVHYLKNHGISTLTPLMGAASYKDLYNIFFADLKNITKTDELIAKYMLTLGDAINSPDEKSFILRKISNYINNKLGVLSQYNVVLPEQIGRKFTNCTIEYDRDIMFRVQGDDLTTDYNKYSRIVNEFYFNNILNCDDENRDCIINILNKAFISKVAVGGKTYPVKSFLLDGDDLLRDKISFNYSSDSDVILFGNKEFRKLLEYFLCKVQHYINENNYVMATIHMANYDIIYDIVESNASNEYDKLYDVSKEIIKDFLPYDYNKKIRDFPKSIQKDLEYLIKIIELDEIYKAYYRFNVEIQKNQSYANIRINGGFASSIDELKLRNKLYPYIFFIIGNDIFIDVFVETKNFFESTILGSLEHNLMEDDFHINVLDLFILIKYCKKNKLEDFARKLFTDKRFLAVCKISINEIIIIKNYLLSSIKNICHLFYFEDQRSIYLTSIHNWFYNVILISGFVRWNDKQLGALIDCILPVFEFRTKNVDIYESIKYFKDINLYFYEKHHPYFLKMIDVILNKIILDEHNAYDKFVLTSKTVLNIYATSLKHDFFYENVELLDSALSKLMGKSDRVKTFFTDNLLLDIKEIGNVDVKTSIDNFIYNNVLDVSLKEPSDYISKLMLFSRGYPIPDGFIQRLELFINESIPGKLLNDKFLSADIQNRLPSLLRFLIEVKGLSQFSDALTNIESKMGDQKQ